MLSIEGVSAGYRKTRVLHDVSLSVREGEMVGVLGRNGAGKTTLLRALTGQVTLLAGRIVMDGHEVSRLPPHSRARLGIGYVPQGRDIFAGLSVLDNLRVAAYATRQRNWRESVDEVFEIFPEIGKKRRAAGGTLSGGQQQMLALARALITKPRILLLDEPSEGVQPSIINQIGAAVRRIHQEKNITVVLVEQNLDFAIRLVDTAYILDRGTIVRHLPAKEVLADRDLQHEYLGI
ncbi:MAG: ABC transporter ATP-binding protein [Streptosporangiaceae bacterium]